MVYDCYINILHFFRILLSHMIFLWNMCIHCFHILFYVIFLRQLTRFRLSGWPVSTTSSHSQDDLPKAAGVTAAMAAMAAMGRRLDVLLAFCREDLLFHLMFHFFLFPKTWWFANLLFRWKTWYQGGKYWKWLMNQQSICTYFNTDESNVLDNVGGSRW